MSHTRHRHLTRAVTAALAWSLVAAVLVGLNASPAEAVVPKLAGTYTAAIEPLARYVGQSTCSPKAKPGTVAFANLLLRTYPNSRSLGISRACNVGGQSEHKEGRAFDWGVSVHSARDRASVNALIQWLFKSDAYGNRYAMARRLGIQYIIWNHRIWGSYAAGAGWRKYTGSNPHTDHVHFSLSWAGARKQTSFWHPRDFPNDSGSSPSKPKPKPTPTPTPTKPPQDYPDPTPDEPRPAPALPEPKPPRTLDSAQPLSDENLSVPTSVRAGARTVKALAAGRRYLIEASGTYRYETKAGSVADSECSTRAGSSWQRERSVRADQWDADHLDLYVDGHDLQAEADNGQSCDDGHVYRWVYEPQRSGRVPFAVWDPTSYRDNRGSLRVHVLDLGAVRDTMSWQVPADRKAGATSPGVLRGGRDYLVTVAGTWQNGQGGTADAECALSDGRWRRDIDSYDMLAGDWGYDSASPRISGVRTLPVSGGSDCDPGHTYTWVQHADRTTPLNVRVSDPDGFADNTGALEVSVAPYDGSATDPAPTPTPTPTPTPAPSAPEYLHVDSRSATPVRTTREYPAGTSLRVTASGMYFLRDAQDWVVADAECTVTSTDYRWRPTRLDGVFNGQMSPLGDLVVNGGLVTWTPSSGWGSCDSSNHEYTYDLTTTRSGPLWFVVADDDYSNNKGTLDVEVETR